MEKKGKFDYILLETSGLADPGPIAGMFWMDEALCSEIYLDGIATLVDLKNFEEVKADCHWAAFRPRAYYTYTGHVVFYYPNQ